MDHSHRLYKDDSASTISKSQDEVLANCQICLSASNQNHVLITKGLTRYSFETFIGEVIDLRDWRQQ